MSKRSNPLLTLVLFGLMVLALALVVVSQSTGGLFNRVSSVERASASELDVYSANQLAALRSPDVLLNGSVTQRLFLPQITR